MRKFQIVWCLVLIASVARSGEPVPPELLNGNRLTIPDLKYSLESPNSDFVWSQAAPRAFTCVNSKTNLRLVIMAGPSGGQPHDENAVKNMLAGIKKASASQDFEIANEKIEKSEFPLADKSFRLSYEMKLANGKKAYVFMYSVNIDNKFILNITGGGADAAEPPELLKFVKSLRAAP